MALVTYFGSLAQNNDSLQTAVSALHIQNEVLRTEVNEIRQSQSHLKFDFERQEAKADSLQAEIKRLEGFCNELKLDQTSDRNTINNRIDETNNSVSTTQSNLSSQASQGIMVAAIVLIISIGLLWFAIYLKSKVQKGGTAIDQVLKAQETLKTAHSKLQEESLKLDSKLLEIAEKQLENPAVPEISPKIDHSLILKVADEVARIEVNLSRMDPATRGYKQLTKAIQRIKDNFMANNYEFVEMLGKPYNERMKVIADFVLDENLQEGQQIISGITKPQINYNGKMIQAAQIKVSQNL